MLSSPQHRRLSLSAESQRGLALKATDFFFPLASHTKEGQFVNYLLVSAQQKVPSLKLPPPFDFAQIWLQGLKKEKKKEEIERKKTDGVCIQRLEWLYLGAFLNCGNPQAFRSASKKNLTKMIGLPFLVRESAKKSLFSLFHPFLLRYRPPGSK